MIGTMANLFLNLLIVALLATTIGYCWVLNRRIRILQDGKSELAELLNHFDESTQRASDSILALQTASKKIGETIQLRTEKANYLMDDLSFMMEKAERMVNRIDASAAVSRARSKAMAEPSMPDIEEPMVKPLPVIERPVAEKTAKAPTAREKTAASLEAMLERIVGGQAKRAEKREEPKLEPEARPKTLASSARSRAEQELLEMIRSGMKG